ncbi:gliding motility lipoprotein GldB [Flavobacterium rhizosphaerae]|uniref:Gliding motility lipoprotein GldB n=1 Tax=Flavobacterium rhizosphaerae TaxID=3163298 RepID=A0ABW8Z2B1_9FLAO
MKKNIIILFAVLIVFSCKKENETEEKIAEIPVEEIAIERFDKLFFETKPENLPGLKKKFPFLFPANVPDAEWVEKQNNEFERKLYTEVQKKYPDLDTLQQNITSLYRHIKFYYPETPRPRVITLVYDNLDMKCVYEDGLILIPLSLYLGKDNELYVSSMDKYHLQEHEPSQIVPDIVTAFSSGKIAPPADRTLLSLMVFYGKQLYLKDLLIPDVGDNDKIGYTKEQEAWAEVNEEEIWRYFVDRKLLFDNDSKLPGRFINPAPFSKFYLELDNESPGRLGQWLGWQIVRAYAQNNKNVPLQELMATDARTIFENSKYKPKK